VSVFFDTNVLVYCTDTTAPEKQAIARTLVAQASASGDADPGPAPAGLGGWRPALRLA
jgi:hypothetical protein